MGDLVPAHLSVEDTKGTKLKHCSIPVISEWLHAFAVYVSVIARIQPEHIPDLMGYQILVLEASNKYRNNGWLSYDKCFRQQAASHPNWKWSTKTPCFGISLSLVKPEHAVVNTASVYSMCLETEFAPSASDILPSTTLHLHIVESATRPRCSFPNYRYKHVCCYCVYNPAAIDINHKAIFCWNEPTQ